MLYIKKSKEPFLLTEYKKDPLASFSSMTSGLKREIKLSLLEEQGYLCAYCMNRISLDNMKVEHYLPQSKYPEKALSYRNLLAVCDGGTGTTQKNQCCDSHKGNIKLRKVDPLDKSTIDVIKYDRNGTIDSDDSDVKYDIDNILNLNCMDNFLPSNRRNVYQITIQKMLKGHKETTWKKTYIHNVLSQLLSKNDKGKLNPYIGISIYFLNKKLS